MNEAYPFNSQCSREGTRIVESIVHLGSLARGSDPEIVAAQISRIKSALSIMETQSSQAEKHTSSIMASEVTQLDANQQ